MKADFSMPEGLYRVPDHELDLRPDTAVDHDILNPKPITGEKNIFFFWHSGYATMHPYTKRNIRAWHRRFSKKGWSIYVLDRADGSPLNIANFLDVKSKEWFPQAFIDGRLGGTYGIQHTSDLVRWPLLLNYGGVYSDVGMIQIGDLDRLWSKTVGDTSTPYEILSYEMGNENYRCLSNYFLCSRKDNPLWLRCHRLLLALWDEDGGKTETDGMHASPLLKELPLMPYAGETTIEENGKIYGPQDISKLLTDYIIQGQAMTQAMGLKDDEDGWNGPEYCSKHIYAIDYMAGSQLINEYTAWNGPRAFELMSLQIPKAGEEETPDQAAARQIVEGCLTKSWGFKLAHGIIIRILGPTLGSLWRSHEDSDIIPGSYAEWFRHGTVYWNQVRDPEKLDYRVLKPTKVGPLLRSA